MNITGDTNVLVRAITDDDPVQSPVAQRLLREADSVAVPDAALCELCWVLGRAYRFPPGEIAQVIEALANADTVMLDHQVVEAGLAMLRAGGDFADGVIAWSGQSLGGETFVSFDRTAVALLKAQGTDAMAL